MMVIGPRLGVVVAVLTDRSSSGRYEDQVRDENLHSGVTTYPAGDWDGVVRSPGRPEFARKRPNDVPLDEEQDGAGLGYLTIVNRNDSGAELFPLALVAVIVVV